MSNSNGVITKPVRMVEDVATILNSTSRDLGTLCTSSAINMWSKHKPFRNSAIAFTSDTQRNTALSNAHYGLQLPTAVSASSLMSQYAGISQNQIVWTYLKPQGAAYNEWFRLLDFDGYDHKAVMPFDWNLKDSTIARIDPIEVLLSPNAEIGINDLGGDLSNMYCGMVIRKQGQTSDVRVITKPSASNFSISQHLLAAGTYDIIFCFSSKQYQLLDYQSGGTFVPSPKPYRILTIVEGTGITLRCSSIITQNTSLTFNLTFNSVGNKSRSLTSITVYYVLNGGYNSSNVITDNSKVVVSFTIGSRTVSSPVTVMVGLNLGTYISNWRTSGRVIVAYNYQSATYRHNLNNALNNPNLSSDAEL